ncbi:MAG: glycosyltransferase family 2 protein [Pirellulales bacterium]
MTHSPINSPLISVVIPVRNSPEFLRKCVAHLTASTYDNIEIIVVDDASTDNTAEIAESLQVRVVRLNSQTGPAGARNLGVDAAQGEFVFFIDADVCVHADTVEKLVDTFVKTPDVDAVFGSYDLKPYVSNVISQYKNLFHHYVHQQACEEASTFWSGCGAVRRKVFLEMGGFDTSYGRPCIEDVELGVRLYQAGKSILLNKSIQVTHLKRWTLWGLIKTDFWDRGVPWTELMLRSGKIQNDLNLKFSQRICAIMAVSILVMLMIGVWQSPVLLLLMLTGLLSLQLLDWWTLSQGPPFWIRLLGVCLTASVVLGSILHFQLAAIIVFALHLMIVIINYKFYLFFAREKSLLFAALVVPLHFTYYLYSVASFATGIVLHIWKTRLAPVLTFRNSSANRC